MTDFRRIQYNAMKKIEENRDSKLLVYFHDDSMSYGHVPLIYNQLKKMGKVKNLDIFLSSNGGDPDAAYKIVKMCREHCENKLSVIVPFMAKSAATLLAIGTDEIVMGSPSELGPIDPQISDRRSGIQGATQSIRDCLDFVHDRFMESDNIEITSYIYMPILDKLDPFTIGMFERAVKMSKQYAELLLRQGMLKDRTDDEIETVVKKLSESYYSHGYAINSTEAKEELFLNVIDYSDEEIWQDIWQLYLSHYLNSMDENQRYLRVETLETVKEDILRNQDDKDKENPPKEMDSNPDEKSEEN